MRVLLDPNILVSYLLMPRNSIRLIVDAALVGAYELLIPKRLLDQLAATIAEKGPLKTRIPSEVLAGFLDELKDSATEIAEFEGKIHSIKNDPKDDYLIANALAGEANLVVSDHRNLTVLGQVENLAFINPSDFVRLLEVSP